MTEFTGAMTTGGKGAYTEGGTIKVHGLKEVYDALQKLPQEVRESIMNKAMREGAKIILEAIKVKAPKGTGLYKGKPKGHVGDAAYITRAKWEFGNVTIGIKMNRNKGFNWHFLEFGTGSYYQGTGTKSKRREYRIPKKIGGGPIAFQALIAGATGEERGMSQYVIRHHGMHPGIKPRPFIRPAFHQNINSVIERIKTVTKDGIEKQFAKDTATTRRV